MTRINKVKKAIKYITGKEVTGDFKTIGQLLDGFNKDCEENGLKIPVDQMPVGYPKVENGAVGQTIVVKAVDENGFPTEWEAAKMPEEFNGEVNWGNNYKLQVGGNGTFPAFKILYMDEEYITISHTGVIKYVPSNSYLDIRGQSVLRNRSTDKKNITISCNSDDSSSENSISISDKKGKYISISGDGHFNTTHNAFMFGTSEIFSKILRYVANPQQNKDAANKEYVDSKISDTAVILNSSTEGSSKKFKITVDDSGALTATEITG